MRHTLRAVALAAPLAFAGDVFIEQSTCRAADEVGSASDGTCSPNTQSKPAVHAHLTFKDRILATYDVNHNGRLDGKERTAARSVISRYNSQKTKYVYAQQRYRHAVRTAQIAYTQAAMRPRPVSLSFAPSISSGGSGGDCIDSRYGTVNVSSPAMRRVDGPPPASSPGLIHMPATKIQCCSPGSR